MMTMPEPSAAARAWAQRLVAGWDCEAWSAFVKHVARDFDAAQVRYEAALAALGQALEREHAQCVDAQTMLAAPLVADLVTAVAKLVTAADELTRNWADAFRHPDWWGPLEEALRDPALQAFRSTPNQEAGGG